MAQIRLNVLPVAGVDDPAAPPQEPGVGVAAAMRLQQILRLFPPQPFQLEPAAGLVQLKQETSSILFERKQLSAELDKQIIQKQGQLESLQKAINSLREKVMS